MENEETNNKKLIVETTTATSDDSFHELGLWEPKFNKSTIIYGEPDPISKKDKKLKPFEFYIDTKKTVWNREYYTIDALNEKQACAIMKKQYENGDLENTDDEILYDTIEDMAVKDNNGLPTVEIYKRYGDEQLIWDNTQSID